MSLLRDERGYGVLDHGQGLTYRFGSPRPDGVRLLAAVENANGFALRFRYDEHGYLTHFEDSAKRQFAVQCDGQGRLLTISTAHPTEPKQRVTLVQYAYNEAGELVRATDALGQFRLAGLPPGTYALRAGALGYKAKDQPVTLVAGDGDYEPLVRQLVEDGFAVTVLYWAHASRELRDAAAVFCSLDGYIEDLALG